MLVSATILIFVPKLQLHLTRRRSYWQTLPKQTRKNPQKSALYGRSTIHLTMETYDRHLSRRWVPRKEGEVVRKSIGNAVKKLEGLGGVKNVAVDASLDFNAAGK
jgi:hypothetical protein